MNGRMSKHLRRSYAAIRAENEGKPSPTYKQFRRVIVTARRNPAPVIKPVEFRQRKPAVHPRRAKQPTYSPVIVLGRNHRDYRYWGRRTRLRWRKKMDMLQHQLQTLAHAHANVRYEAMERVAKHVPRKTSPRRSMGRGA